MLENLLALSLEETANFLDSRELLEQVSILKLGSVFGVVSHEVLGKEDAGVKATTDARVDFVCTLLVRETINLAGQKLDAGQKDGVELACQVNVVVFFRARDLDHLLLQAKQVLNVTSLEVFSEELGLVIETGTLVRSLTFLVLSQNRRLLLEMHNVRLILTSTMINIFFN